MDLKKMYRRCIALLLAVCMLGGFPVKAAAQEEKQDYLGTVTETLVELVEARGREALELIWSSFDMEVVLDDDFTYAAIGDGSAESRSYVDNLAEMLNETAQANGIREITLHNYARMGNTTKAERENLSDISNADLITVGFSMVSFLRDAVSGDVNVDWESLVGAENVPYINRLMKEVKTKIDATAMEASLKDLVNRLVEASAYCAAQYVNTLPKLLDEICRVNRDARIVIVGMYNPLDGISFGSSQGGTLELSDYVDRLVTMSAVYSTAYCVATKKAVYVDAPDVSRIYAKNEITMKDITLIGMSKLVDQLYPDKAGHSYIAQTLENALDITVKKTALWGDADGNGRVQTNDAKLILQYCAEMIGEADLDLTVSDVDGNGRIQTNDAKLILQFCAEMIDTFPVEK